MSGNRMVQHNNGIGGVATHLNMKWLERERSADSERCDLVPNAHSHTDLPADYVSLHHHLTFFIAYFSIFAFISHVIIYL